MKQQNKPTIIKEKNSDTDHIVLTRKIRLFFDMEDDQSKREARKQIWNWQYICMRCANFVSSHHYLQDLIKDLIYITEDTKIKLANIANDPDGIFTTSKQNTTYQLLSKKFGGEMPSAIYSTVNRTVANLYIKERSEYFLGTRSLRNYKKNMPIPFPAIDIKNLRHDKVSNEFLFEWFGIKFKTHLGRDRSNNRIMIERVIETRNKYGEWQEDKKSFEKTKREAQRKNLTLDIDQPSKNKPARLPGEFKLCTSSLSINGAEIYLNMAIEQDKSSYSQIEGKVAYAVLDTNIPIKLYVGKEPFNAEALNDTEKVLELIEQIPHYIPIGNREEFLVRRVGIQAARRRAQKSAISNRAQHGRKRKLKNLQQLKDTEINYVDSQLHLYSRRLIDMCIHHGIENLVLVNLIRSESQEKENPFLLLNFSSGGLSTKITYKANAANLKLFII